MDDLLDLSPLEQELEALSAIYLDELKLCRSNNDEIQEIELLLHPATGDDTTKQFVRMNLVFRPGSKYPDEVPEIIIRNPRGLGEEEAVSLVEDMKKKALESVGEVMLYTLIEMAKETLTEGNIPHCPCVVCLEHFLQNDLFHRTACYHYFHTRCLHKYLEHSRLQIEEDRKEAAEHKHLNPKDNKEEVTIVCPVCRTTMDDDSLAVFCSGSEEEDEEDHNVIPPEFREQQRRMAELYEKQKAKGAIIDLEWERNKYLVNMEERLPVQVGATVLEKSLEEKSCQEDERKIPLKDEENHRAFDKHHGLRSRGSSQYLPKQPWRRQDHGSNPRDRDHWRARGRGRGGFRDTRDQNRSHFTDGRRENGRWEMREECEEVDSKSKSKSSEGRYERNTNKYRSEDLEHKLHLDVNRGSVTGGATDNTTKDRDSGYESKRERWNEDRRVNWRRGRGGGDKDYRAHLDGPQRRNYNMNDMRESSYGRGHNRSQLGSSSSSDVKEKSQAASSNTFNKDGEFMNKGPVSEENSSRHNDRSSDLHTRYVRDGGDRRGGGRGSRPREERESSGYHDRNQRGATIYPGSRHMGRETLGCREEFSDDEFKKQHSSGEERHQRQEYHNHHRGHSAGRGRGSNSNRGENRRRPGYHRDSMIRDDGGQNRSDQRVRGSSGRTALLNERPHGTENEEDRRKESDVKNAEINQRWRELNFGSRNGQEQGCNRKGFRVIDDDDYNVNAGNGAINDNIYDENGYDECGRRNPHYNPENSHLFYSVASSSSEEDWEKESDPFAFERFRVRPEQYEEYCKYKQQQVAHYDTKINERAERKNAVLEEERRIQNERNRRQGNQDSQQTVDTEHEPEGMSVLDKFKASKKQKDKDYQNHDNEKKTNVITARETSGIEMGGKNLSQGAPQDRTKKSLPLPTRNRAEGIKWVGVRSNMDAENGYGDDQSATSSGVAEKSAFEESWKRREEKRREQKPPRKDKEQVLEKTERYSRRSNSHRNRNGKIEQNKNLYQCKDSNVLTGDGNPIVQRNSNLTPKCENPFNSTDSPMQVITLHEETTNMNGRNNHEAHLSHHNTKKTKPLDFRKKNAHSDSNHRSQISKDNLVDQFPSLLDDSSGYNSKQAENGTGSHDRATTEMPSKCDNMRKDAENNTLLNKASNSKKPKPLDFRKGKSKGLL